MNATSSVVLTGGIVTIGRWSEGKDMNARVMVGIIGLVIALAAMPDELSSKFAVLILIVATLRYGLSITAKLSTQ